MIGKLKDRFGYKCSGIKINAEIDFFVNNPLKKLAFCEALNYSFDVPLVLHKNNISGLGTIRTLGFSHDEYGIATEVAKNVNLSKSEATKILSQIPNIALAVENVVMGITEELEEIVNPDLYIIKTYDEELLRYVGLKMNRNSVHINACSILSVCGGAFAKCFMENKIAISSCCTGAGKKGLPQNDGIIVAIPANEVIYIV
jgi:uncharacterized protein (DUF169 family)